MYPSFYTFTQEPKLMNALISIDYPMILNRKKYTSYLQNYNSLSEEKSKNITGKHNPE